MSESASRVRDRRQLLLVMILAMLIPLIDAIFGLTKGTIGGPVFDEDLHRVGRVMGALHFTGVYLCIMVRLLISDSYRLRHFLIPALLILLLIGALVTALFVHFRDREFIQVGMFEMQGFSLRQIGSGVISTLPVMGVIMVLSPILVPGHYLERLGDLFGQSIKTGNNSFDEYLSVRRKKKLVGKQTKEVIPEEFLPKSSLPKEPSSSPSPLDIEEEAPDVLLVEDDLSCATLVLKFCKKIKLDCFHVEDLQSAKEAYTRYGPHLRLIILDNFVRVGQGHQEGQAKTGSEWARELNQEFQGKKRHFHMAILSGHTHLLQELAQEADLVLQKPWEPQALFRYLKDNDVV